MPDWFWIKSSLGYLREQKGLVGAGGTVDFPEQPVLSCHRENKQVPTTCLCNLCAWC